MLGFGFFIFIYFLNHIMIIITGINVDTLENAEGRLLIAVGGGTGIVQCDNQAGIKSCDVLGFRVVVKLYSSH